jgi:hypothetical protein
MVLGMLTVAELEARYAPCLQPYDQAFTPQALMAEAERWTGLSDWGGTAFSEAGFRHRLDLLCRSLETEAGLNALGRSRAHARIYFNLCGRLGVVDWHSKHPNQAPITDPLIGTGLARTGTSFFHQLLSQDPENLTAPMGECNIPTPPPGDAAFDAARFALMGRIQDFMGVRGPEIEAIHPFQPENAAECLALQASAIGTEYSAFWSLPSFIAQCHADMPELLQWQVAVMQVLQSGKDGRRWLLKTPQHLGHWESMVRAFPQARVFINHRDPAKVVPSLCSLFTTFFKLNTDRAMDPKMVAKGMCARLAENMAQVSGWRAAHPDFPVVDIHYKTMVADPVGEAERVYDAFGLTLSAQARARMESFVKVNRHAHGPKHSYTLADFGLTEADIEEALGAYLDKFGVVRERGKA